MAKRKRNERPDNPSVDEQKRLKFNSRGLIEIRSLMLATEAIARALGSWDNRVGDKARRIRIMWTKTEMPHVTPDFRICLPVPAEVTEDTTARLAMFRDHEVSHILFTDFGDVERALDYDNGKGKNLTAKNLHNAMEDIRIEAALGRIFAGCRANFLKFYKRNEAELHRSLLARRSFVDQVGIACILWANDVPLPTETPDITLRGLEVAKPFVQKIMNLSSEEERVDVTYRKSSKCYKHTMELYDALKKFAQDNADQFQSMESGDLGEGEGEGEEGDSQSKGQKGKKGKKSSKSKKSKGQKGDKSKKGSKGDDKDDDGKDGKSKSKKSKGQKGDDEGDDANGGGDFDEEETGDSDKESDGGAGAGDGEGDGDSDAEGAGGGDSDGDSSDGDSDGDSSDGDSDGDGGDQADDEWGHEGHGSTSEYDPDWVFSAEDMDEIVGEIRTADATMEVDPEAWENLNRPHRWYGSNAEVDPKTGEEQIPNDAVVKISKAIEGHRSSVSPNYHHPQLASMAAFGDKVGQQSSNLSRLLMGMDRTFTYRRRLEGRVDDRLLAEGAMGATARIFKNVKRSKADSVAISLLVDLSGSMGKDYGHNSGKLMEAKRACFALAAVCEKARVKFEINGYTDGHGGVTLYAAKEFHQPWNDETKARVAALNSSGSTPTGEATMLASRRLGLIRADRHILFVVTDGDPNDPDLNLDAIDTVRRAGVEVYGFGIAGSREQSLHHQYGDDGYVYCPSTAAGLEGEMVKLLTKLLTPAMRKVLARG